MCIRDSHEDPLEESNPDPDSSKTLGYVLWGSGVTIGSFIGLSVTILLFFFWNPAPRAPSTFMYQGIGGWLILPTLGTITAPFVAIYLISSYFTPLAEMSAILQAETSFYGWRLYYFSGALIETIYFFLSVLLLILLFTKRTSFPYFYIAIGIFTIVTEIYMIFIESNLADLESDTDRTTELAKIISPSILWSSYMLISQRVKATFTRARGHGSPPPIPTKS